MNIPRFLLEGHAAYLKNDHPELRGLHSQLLKDGQSPEVIWFGCSDSRVMPETIVNSKPGDLFVVRNVGNMVPSFDSGGNSVGSAIEFSVGTLKVGHAIVCGHEDCGAMKVIKYGGVDANKTPSLANWIRTTVKDLGPHAVEKFNLVTLTKQNILLQIERLKTYPMVDAALKEGTLNLHAWYINMSNGHIETYDFEKETWCHLIELP